MTLTITLTSAGANIGPCNLYSDVNNYATAFATGITRAQLMSGYVSTVVPNGTTIVRVTSTGSCTDTINLTVTGNSPITFTVTTTCDAPGTPGTGRVVLSNFQGGNGVYSYVAIGATPAEVAGDLINHTTPLNGATSYTYTNVANAGWFVGIADSTGTRGQDGTTVACNSTTTTTTTTARPRYYYYRYDLDACCNSSNATLVWSYNIYANGYWNIGGTVYELTAEPAATTSIQITSATAASCTANTTQVWTDTGNTRCLDCVNQKEQQQTNPCAAGYNTTRWVAGGSACNTTQNWVNEGDVFCSGCVAYQTQRQTNPCAADYNTTRNVNLGAGAPCDYTPSWVDDGAPFCGEDYHLYQPQTQTNPCAPGSTRDVDLGLSSTCASAYSLYLCDGTGTSYTIVYPVGTFIYSQRVQINSTGAYAWVSGVVDPSFAGSTIVTAVTGSACPATYTLFQDCNGIYYCLLGNNPYDGYSFDVPDSCLFNRGTSDSPFGNEIFNFIPGDCFCP